MINLSLLKSDEYFSIIIKKMFLNQKLNNKELSYSLSCAILFLKKYEKDKKEKNCLAFAYFIVLKVALINKYYIPLYDISIDMGWYPISRFIFTKDLIGFYSVNQVVMDSGIDDFEFDGIIETYKQKNNRIEILGSDSLEKAYVAPTSFGKSKLIQDFLKLKTIKKVGIIVPTKSLLTQTFKSVKDQFYDKKIIFHDEMYADEENFIAIFTQERALRLLSKNKWLSFDLLVIDEAHNLLDGDSRSILLSRLIRRNYSRNSLNRILYLSPLIQDVENLKFDKGQRIFEKRIDFNIKEPSINLFDNDSVHYKYNRFFDDYYEVGNYCNYLDYIINNKKNKNFFYLRKPKSVERLSLILHDYLEVINDENLNLISDSLSKNVHKHFYCVDYVKRGVLYLHGKLPDIIKEYLEYKFKVVSSIKYLVSNSVILEGVNLPIDNLFILNTYGLDTKKMINLMGRVNRLNEVFDLRNEDLNKLNPEIHFVYEKNFTGENANLRNSIKKIKSGIFTDKVKNPVLISFDASSYDGGGSGDGEDQIFINEIKDREDFLISNELDESSKFKCSLIESNIDKIFDNFNIAYDILEKRLLFYKNFTGWGDLGVVEKISIFFLEGMEDYIQDKNLLRLKNEKAKKFYNFFNENRHKFNINQNIKIILSYFDSIKDTPSGRSFYVGPSYGEFSILENSFAKNYIDLSSKNEKEMVNIALIKFKIESDFLSFFLYRFANVLYDNDLLKEGEYNLFVYGSENKETNDFIKLGLSSNIVHALEANEQLSNLTIRKNGTIKANDGFINFLNEQDDLFRFELSKFIN